MRPPVPALPCPSLAASRLACWADPCRLLRKEFGLQQNPSWCSGCQPTCSPAHLQAFVCPVRHIVSSSTVCPSACLPNTQAGANLLTMNSPLSPHAILPCTFTEYSSYTHAFIQRAQSTQQCLHMGGQPISRQLICPDLPVGPLLLLRLIHRSRSTDSPFYATPSCPTALPRRHLLLPAAQACLQAARSLHNA